MLYKFNVEITEQDFYEFNKYHLTTDKENKKGARLIRWYVLLILFFMAVYYIVGTEEPWLVAYIIAIYSAIYLIVIFSANKIMLKSFERWMKKKKKNGELQFYFEKAAVMEFYEEYFTETSEKKKTELNYNAVYKVSVLEGKAIYIYQSPTLVNIIPFSAFCDDAQRAEFIEFIKQKTGK